MRPVNSKPHPLLGGRLLAPPKQLNYRGGRVHLIAISTRCQPATLKQLHQLLSPSEQQEFLNISHAITRQRFGVTRALLRLLLATHIGIAPQRLSFYVGRYGKLALAPTSGCHLNFNLSHCSHYSLLALSARYYVGVDVEQERKIHHPIALAVHLGHEGKALSHPQLLRCWCRSEAVIKLYGASIMQGTLQLPYRLAPYAATRWRCPLPAAVRKTLQLPVYAPLHILDLPTREGWYASLATRGHILSPRLHYWAIEEEHIQRYCRL